MPYAHIWSNSALSLSTPWGPNSAWTFHFCSAAVALVIIWTKAVLVIPLNSLLAPATNLHSLKLFIEFMCHLGYLKTSGVTPDSVVTSDGTLPEPQLACFIPYVKGAKNHFMRSAIAPCTAQ